MQKIVLTLLVLRVDNIHVSAQFYAKFGLHFTEHRHGEGVLHLAAALSDDSVFELYPISPKSPQNAPIRLGFSVENLDEILDDLRQHHPALIVRMPFHSQWGYRAIIRDNDENIIELKQH